MKKITDLLFKDRSLAYKFSLYGFFPLLVVTLFILYYAMDSMAVSFLTKNRKTNISLAELSALSLSNMHVIDNQSFIDNLVDGLAGKENIIYAMVVEGKSQKIIVHSNHALEGNIFASQANDYDLAKEEILTKLLSEKNFNQVYNAASPIIISGKQYGFVQIGFSFAEVFQEISSLQKSIILIALIAIIFGLGLFIMLGRIISKPVDKMAEQILEIGSGKFDQQIFYHNHDVLGELASAVNKMAVSLKDNVSEIEKKEARYRALFEAANDGVVVLDDDNILEYNSQTLNIFGCSGQEIIGKSLLDFSPETQPDGSLSEQKIAKKFKDVLSEGGQRFYWRFNRLDGSSFDAEVSMNMAMIDGRPVVQTIIQDISVRMKAEEKVRKYSEKLEEEVHERTKALEDKTEKLEKSRQALTYLLEDVNEAKKELENANEKLKDLDRLKSLFIASMSHELRTPLNSIIGFTGIILQGIAGDINPEQQDQLGRVYGAAKHLLALITDVIDISKIEAGKLDVYAEEFYLSEVVEDAVSNVSERIKQKKLALEINIPEGLKILSDRRRVLQCVLNYLSNAVRYTEQGQIILSASVNQETLEVRVADTGIGIKNDDIPMLFNSFVRLNSHLKTTVLGTGLGLYLTKKIVTEMLGGSVKVESVHGEGSIFTFSIPLRYINKGENN